MLSNRLLYVLLVALATLLMSFRPPAPLAARISILVEDYLEYSPNSPVEEAENNENKSSASQQGPLEEIHDLHCPVNRQLLSLNLQHETEASSLHPDVWMCIPLMSCFQPPERD